MIRNFCIIAHIDHGKSTLADRMLQLTGVVDDRAMRAQYLDRMDIERERGITIKSQAVRLPWATGARRPDLRAEHDRHPGPRRLHLRGVPVAGGLRGAVLLVDAAQGIEAQTLANLYLALRTTCTSSRCSTRSTCRRRSPRSTPRSSRTSSAATRTTCCGCRGKTGEGVEELLDEIVRLVPHPVGDPDAPARAMIFDSVYDRYRGVITYVRVIDGNLSSRERILMLSTKAQHEMLEIGVISPEPTRATGLGVGEAGYHHRCEGRRPVRVGDTVTNQAGV